jgi:hypothetical protein
VTFTGAASHCLQVRRLAACGLVVLGLVLLAGCGSQPSGRLVVGIQHTGGAWPASGRLSAGRVVIFDEHGHRAGVLRVKAGKTATAELPPGHYSVGLDHGRPTAKQLDGCQPKIATVTGSHTTHYMLWLGCWPSTAKGVLASVVAAGLAQKSVRLTESYAADLYGTDHTTLDATADSGSELFDYYGAKMRVLLVDHTVYVQTGADLLDGETMASPGLNLTKAQAKRYAGKWISIPEGDKLYAGLAGDLTLASVVKGAVPTTPSPYGGSRGKLTLSRRTSNGRPLLVLRTTSGTSRTPPINELRARGSGTPLPVSYSDYLAMMVFDGGTFSRWNEPVHVHAPARSTPIATVRG